jgi:heme-degrading monooxygenase HmoA
MFVTMRRYSPKNGAANKASMELLRRQIQNEFLPVIQQVPGFRAYYVLNVDNREVITLSFCDTQEGVAEFSRCAAEYTFRNPLVYELGRPDVTESEVLTHLEASPEPAGEKGDGGRAVGAAIALWLEESRGMLLTASEP